MMYRKKGKRFLDLLLALLAIIPFSGFILVIAIVSVVVFKGKAFFLHERLGYRNRVFYLYKFATLLPEKADGKILSLSERQNAWGKFLRDYSLDELLQIINILKGEMSFVGPRPLLPEYKELYTPQEAIRHEVKPGLTGLAQVKGRNSLNWHEKMRYDQQYVAKMSFFQDVQILLKTISVVLKGQSVNFGKGPEIEVKEMQEAEVKGEELKWHKA